MSAIWLPMLVVHVAGGGAAIFAGAAAMTVRKGSPFHAVAGRWFFGAMLVMGASAAPLALHDPDRLSATAAVLAMYLVATSWQTARRRDGRPGWLEWAALPVALGCMAANIALGVAASGNLSGEIDGNPAIAYYVFAGLAGLAATLDINMLARGQMTPPQRLARHLWRMCTAYFLAATSLFLGQQDDVFPFMRGSPILLVPSLLTLMVMALWLFKIRIRPVLRKAGVRRTQTINP